MAGQQPAAVVGVVVTVVLGGVVIVHNSFLLSLLFAFFPVILHSLQCGARRDPSDILA